MIRRVGAWLRRSWSVVTDVHGAVESEDLVQALVEAAVEVAQAACVQCADHPDLSAVVQVWLTDGTMVGQCQACVMTFAAAELADPPGVAVAG